jgi:membrane-associated phospholipid phosphatase
MPETTRHVLTTKPGATTSEKVKCPSEYDLRGPQVEPEASWWIECRGPKGDLCPLPRPVTLDEFLGRVDLKKHPFPTDADTKLAEIEELIMLARLRDEPAALAHKPETTEITKEPQQLRLPLSVFLQLRPQPPGAAINSARDTSFPVVNSGRELARYFENETPGLAHQLALNYMIRETMWSPPRQALVWATLNTAIYSALEVAWYLKWRGGKGIERRPRPWECFQKLDVLFDRLPNSTNSADGPRRGFPFGVQPLAPNPPRPEPPSPEASIPDVLTIPPSQPTPGTPRHPAYPSGHSTYSAAASRVLIKFFPNYEEQLLRLANNIGVARLWAGVHWRSDHDFGQIVGTAVAELILEQINEAAIPLQPAPRPADEKPPKPVPRACAG